MDTLLLKAISFVKNLPCCQGLYITLVMAIFIIFGIAIRKGNKIALLLSLIIIMSQIVLIIFQPV